MTIREILVASLFIGVSLLFVVAVLAVLFILFAVMMHSNGGTSCGFDYAGVCG
jgi:hypothetical protein